MPRDRFTHTAAAAVSRDRAWARLQDPETWGAIGGVNRVWDAVHNQGRLVSYRFEVTAGLTYQGKATVTVSEPPQRMVVMIDTSELGGNIAVDLADGEPSSTEVTVALELEAKGLLSTAMFPVVSGAVRSGLPDNVDSFVRRLEGE